MNIDVNKDLSKKMGYKKVASVNAGPQTTLERYDKKIKEEGDATISLKLEKIYTYA